MTSKHWAILAALILPLAGCESTPDSTSDQDAALSDPFNYKVDMPDDVSGGKIQQLDKQGIKGDFDRFLNP
jgi:hypothetical protein